MRGLGLIVLSVTLWGCGQRPAAVAPPPTPRIAGVFADAQITDAVMGKWSRSCALCHVNGAGGAPRTGDIDAWRARLTQGEDTLLTHSIDGFNRMPPLGYCMACERDDLRAMIKYMAGDA